VLQKQPFNNIKTHSYCQLAATTEKTSSLSSTTTAAAASDDDGNDKMLRMSEGKEPLAQCSSVGDEQNNKERERKKRGKK
jgi:hypothetical protein